jgi:hypothetical protein
VLPRRLLKSFKHEELEASMPQIREINLQEIQIIETKLKRVALLPHRKLKYPKGIISYHIEFGSMMLRVPEIQSSLFLCSSLFLHLKIYRSSAKI